MTFSRFATSFWLPAVFLAALVCFVLAFLLEEPVGDPVIGTVLGLAIWGLPLAYLATRKR